MSGYLNFFYTIFTRTIKTGIHRVRISPRPIMKNRYSDEQLITLLASPETYQVDKAIAQLYYECKDMVFRLIKRNNGTDQDAEEVLDDALIGLWEAVQANRYQPTARLKTYVYQIARFIWLKRLREAARDIVLCDTDYVNVQYQIKGIDEIYELKETFDAYWDKIRALGGKCYKVLWAFAEGYTMQEIATRYELGSANNAKAVKYNCLRKAGKPID